MGVLIARVPLHARAFALYAGISFAYFGVPVVAHPSRDLIGFGVDPELVLWWLGWWPHAVLQGMNPIVTHLVWAPEGVNLAWVTSVPGLALLVSPVTLLAGPVFAYNLLTVLLPALAAWTAFLLCRHVTGAFWPSLLGGYLFGFASFMLGHSEGHSHLTSVFLVPLVGLVLLRFLESSLSDRRCALLLGVLFAAQFSFSTEVTLMLGSLTTAGAVAAYAIVPTARSRLRRLPRVLAGGALLAALIDSPLLIYILLHFQHGSINQPEAYPADLLNPIIPTRLTWLGWHWTQAISDQFAGNSSENGAYLGLPLVAILAGFVWDNRRRPAARFVVVMLVLCILAELGTSLRVRGIERATLPWNYVARFPPFNNILPVRFSIFVALAAAVAAAWWAASTRMPRPIRITLPLLAVIAIMPHLWLPAWHEHPHRVSFFTDGIYRACIQPSDNVFMLPFPKYGDAMLWQAETNFAFRMADGYLSSLLPPKLRRNPYAVAFASSDNPANDWRPLIQLAKTQKTTLILIEHTGTADWTRILAPVTQPAHLAGVTLYSLRANGRSPCTTGTT